MMDLADLKRMLFGDRRDQRLVLREVGFADEAEAATWARGLGAPHDASHELALVLAIHRARPDLTLRTATYIARQTITRG